MSLCPLWLGLTVLRLYPLIVGPCLALDLNLDLDLVITYQFGVHWVWAHNLTMHALGILFNHSYGLSYLTKLVMVFFFIFIFTFHIRIHFRGGFLFHVHWYSYIFAFYINLLRKGYHWNNQVAQIRWIYSKKK